MNAAELSRELRSVKSRIAKNELDEALNELMALFEDHDPEAYDECISLYRRFHAADKEYQLQLISYENYNLSVNNVSYGLLKLCTRQLRQLEGSQAKSAAGIAMGDSGVRPGESSEAGRLIELGIADYESNDYAGAVAAFEKALEKDGGAAQALFYLGVIREEIGEEDEARDFYTRAIAADPGYAAAYNNRGVLMLLNDEYQAALQDLNKALELDPKLYIAYLNRASVFINLDEYTFAMEDLNRCARSGTSLPEVFRLRSLSRLNLDDYQGAIDDADRGLNLNAGDPFLYFSKATALAQLGRYREAIPVFDQALNLNPAHIESLRLRAMCRCMTEDYKGGQEDLNVLLRMVPGDDQGLFWQGYVEQQTGDPAAAIRSYSAAVASNPHNKTAYFNRGLIEMEFGHYQEAYNDFKMAHDLDPDWDLVPPYIEQAQQKLKGGFWNNLFG